MPGKMLPDVAAEIASSESLSFASLVCIQDRKEDAAKVGKEDPNFEFSNSNGGSAIGNPNNFPGDKLPLNGHRKTTSCASQHQLPKQVPLQDFLSQIPSHKRDSDMKQSNPKSTGRKHVLQGKRTNEKATAGQKSFSQKLFSFATPCRDCRATKPTASIKKHTLQ